MTGSSGARLTKYDSTGIFQWHRILDSGGMTQGGRVTVTASDQVVVAGSTDAASPGSTLVGAQDLLIAQVTSRQDFARG